MYPLMTNFLEKSFWPLMASYSLYVLYWLYSYYADLNPAVNRAFYNNLYFGKLKTVGLILGIAFIFKVCDKTGIASLVLGIPALFKIVSFILVLLVWLFLAAVMIVFGKS